MCSARAASGGGGTDAAVVAAVAAAPCCAILVLVSTSPCKLLIPAAMAVSRCCFVGGPVCAALALLSMRPGNVELELAAAPACWLPGCAAPAQLSEFCGWPLRMFTMEVTRCRLVGMPGCAALACASVCGDRVELELAAALTMSKGRLPVPPATAGCSALLAGAPVWPSRLARNLLPSVMTACCNSVIKVANGRRRL